MTLLLVLGTGNGVFAREGVSLPVSCDVRSDRVILQPSPPTTYEIVSERRRDVFSACRPDRPHDCRPVLIYRFEVACGEETVEWMDLAAALMSASGSRVSVKNDRLHIRPRPKSGLGKCDTADPAFSFMKACDPWMQDPTLNPDWVLPPGFAPVHEVGARFVELPPADTVDSPPPQSDPPPAAAESDVALQSHAPEIPVPVLDTATETAEAPEPSAADPELSTTDATIDEPVAQHSMPARADSAVPLPAPEPQSKSEPDLRMVSLSGWSSTVTATGEEVRSRPGLQFLSTLEHFAARLQHLRLEQEFTAALMGIALLSGLLSGIGWYSARSRRIGAPAFTAAEHQPMSLRPSSPQPTGFKPSTGTLLVPSDEKMCGELCRTAHTMLQQIDARVDELQGVAPLRRVLQREMRNLEQFLTAVMAASPAEPEEWRRMRNRLQRIVKELHRLRDIVEGAYRSLSGGGFTSREPPRDRYEAYEALGANPDISLRTLKKLVDALRACWHPDLAKDEPDRLAREERMKRINIAWDIITSKRQEA